MKTLLLSLSIILMLTLTTFAQGALLPPAPGSSQPPRATPIPSAPSTDVWIHVDLSLQRLEIRKGSSDEVVSTYPVSTGRKGLETPTGKFKVLGAKVDDRNSKEVPMPYCLRLDGKPGKTTDYEIGIHGSPNIGLDQRENFPASHACIRLSFADAKTVFNTPGVGKGTEVVIDGDIEDYYRGHFDPYQYLAINSAGKILGFKCASASATPEDKEAFLSLVKAHKVTIDNNPHGKPTTDKDKVCFRFEFQDVSTGLPVSEFERLYGVTLNIKPRTRR